MSPSRSVRVVPCTQLMIASRRGVVVTSSIWRVRAGLLAANAWADTLAYSPISRESRSAVLLGITVSRRRGDVPRLRALSTAWKRSPAEAERGCSTGTRDESHSKRVRSSTPDQGRPAPVTAKPLLNWYCDCAPLPEKFAPLEANV